MPLRVTVVGSSSAYSRQPGRASSCYLVESGEDAIVLDLGQGAFSALAGFRDPATVRAYLISHLHPDHWIDLVPLRHYLRFGEASRRTAELYAPADIRRRADAVAGEVDFLGNLEGGPLEPGRRMIGKLTVEARRVRHTDSSFAFRVSEGADTAPGLVYSGDCGRADDLVPLIQPGDTLLAEASFGAGEAIPGVEHLTSGEAARAATEGGAKRLVITHVLDGVDRSEALRAAAERFEGETILAEPGLTLEVE